jgi:hypothetical protein
LIRAELFTRLCEEGDAVIVTSAFTLGRSILRLLISFP